MIRIKLINRHTRRCSNRHAVLLDSVQFPRCSLAGFPIRRARRRADLLGAASVLCGLRNRKSDAISEQRGPTDCDPGGQHSTSGRAQ